MSGDLRDTHEHLSLDFLNREGAICAGVFEVKSSVQLLRGTSAFPG